jgi:hypothetical protein
MTRAGLGLVAAAGVLSLSAMSSVHAQQYPPATIPPSIVPPNSVAPSVVPAPSVAPSPAPAAAAPTTIAVTTTVPAKIPAEVLSVTVKPAPAVTVEAANIAASQPAYTGANSTGLALAGAGLFAGGAALVLAAIAELLAWARRWRPPTAVVRRSSGSDR